MKNKRLVWILAIVGVIIVGVVIALVLINNRKELNSQSNKRHRTSLNYNNKKSSNGSNSFTIRFNSRGGSEVESVTLECGKAIELPSNPTRTGHVFLAWRDRKGKEIKNGDVLSCKDTTLYAEWKLTKK